MGAITEALASCCRSRGVEIVTGAAVAEVSVAGGSATGAVLEDGRVFAAPVVAANTHPRVLFGQLI